MSTVGALALAVAPFDAIETGTTARPQVVHLAYEHSAEEVAEAGEM